MAKHVYGRVVAADYTHGRAGGQPRPIPRGAFVKLTTDQFKAIESRLEERAGLGRDRDVKVRAAIEKVTAEDAKGHFVHDLTGGAGDEPEPAKQ